MCDARFAVGAIVGMTVVLRGFNAVVWSQHQDAFPYIKGMVPIFLSWVVSPFLAAICVIILYGLILRPFVLRSQHSFVRAFYVSTTVFESLLLRSQLGWCV